MEELIQINNAFYRLEKYINNNIKTYYYFGFEKAFNTLFKEIEKPENYTFDNCNFISNYWQIIQYFILKYEHEEFNDLSIYENKILMKDIDELYVLYNKPEIFVSFSDEENDITISLNDILNFKLLPDPKTPFTDPKTHELFNYIVDNWDYDKGQKWADIWNAINDLENHKPPYKNEYQNYIITRFGYTGKFQYDKPKKEGNRDKQRLLELIKEFSKK